MASVKPDGTPKIQQVSFHKFLETDNDIILLTGSIRNPDLMGVVGSKCHELQWLIGSDVFTMTGRIYLVAAPSLSFRYGNAPRRLVHDIADPQAFWEAERVAAWESVTNTYRASFTWPVSGEIISYGENEVLDANEHSNCISLPMLGVKSGYKHTSLAAKDMFSTSDELKAIRNSAMDNFCLLVFKPAQVDVKRSAGLVPTRSVYLASQTPGKWDRREVNA